LRQTMSDDPGPAAVISPSGEAITLPLASSQPGVFTGSTEVDEIGLYQVGNGDLSALAHVGPVNAPEFADTISTENVLRQPAEASGGSVRRIASLTGVSLPGIVPVRGSANASGNDWI